MSAHIKAVAVAQRQGLMGYLRECQIMGALPDIHEVERRSGCSNRQAYRMVDDYKAWLEAEWIISEGPDFEILTRDAQEQLWESGHMKGKEI